MLAGGVYFTRYQLVLPCITAFSVADLDLGKVNRVHVRANGGNPDAIHSRFVGQRHDVILYSASFAAQRCVVGSLDRVRGLRGLTQPHKAGVVCCAR